MTIEPQDPGETSNDRVTAIYAAYLRHEASLKRFISRLLRRHGDVDDVAQEAFLRAYEAAREQAIRQPKSLLFRIAKHVAFTRLTRKSQRVTDYLEDLEDSEVIQEQPSAEEEISAQEIIGLHCEAIANLPPQCRQVYLLRKVHGLSRKEISLQMGIAVSTVEKHLIKAISETDRYLKRRTESRLQRIPARRRGRTGSEP